MSTLERRLAAFDREPLREGARRLAADRDRLATALRPYRRRVGDPRTRPAWQARILALHRKHSGWAFPQFWGHLVDVVRDGDDDVLHEAVTRDDGGTACVEIVGRPCSKGDHLHWLDADDRLHPLARVPVRHFVQRPHPRPA